MKKAMTLVFAVSFLSALQVTNADEIKRTDNNDGTTTFDHGSGVTEHVKTEEANRVARDYQDKGYQVKSETKSGLSDANKLLEK